MLFRSLKTAAWWFTGSVSLAADALESLVNLAGAVFALAMVTLAAQPPDAEHPYGHHKAEYFSSGFEGVLILASGTATHNLRALDRREDGQPNDWTAAFDGWLTQAVESGDEAALADYRQRAPYAEMAHPRDEHLMPLFVAFGAGGGRPGRKVHGSFSRGTMSMSAFAFD